MSWSFWIAYACGIWVGWNVRCIYCAWRDYRLDTRAYAARLEAEARKRINPGVRKFRLVR